MTGPDKEAKYVILGEKAKAQLVRDSKKDIEISITELQKNPLNYTQVILQYLLRLMVLGMNLLSKFTPITFFVIYWCPLLPCYVSESSNFPLFTLAGCEFLFPSNLVRIYYVFIWHVRKEFLFLWRHACCRVDIWMEMYQIPYSMSSWRKNKISHESATMGQPLTNLPTSPWV